MSDVKRVCFGIPSVFSFSSRTCSTCPDFGQCRHLAHEELKAVEESPAIRALLVEHERNALTGAPAPLTTPEVKTRAPAPAQARISRAKLRSYELTDHQKTMIASVPKRVGEALTKLFRRGHDVEIRMALRDGKEPLAGVGGYRSLKVALARLKGGFDRQSLRTYFMDELGWSYSSAWNEVSLTWSILQATGIGIERNGRMVVAPSVLAKN